MRPRIALVLLFTFSVCVNVFPQTGDSRWARFEGNRVHFLDTGTRTSKDAIVFVHGWMCNAEFWSRSVRAFPGRRVIAVDLIGHGRSDKPALTYTIDVFARSVATVLKEARVSRAVLVGHSMGTPVARQLYRLYPEMVNGLVIVDGSLRPYFTSDRDLQFLSALRDDYDAVSREFVQGMVAQIRDEALRKKITRAMLAGPKHVGIGAMEALNEQAIWKPEPINVPVLAIYDSSAGWPEDNENFIRSLAPKLDYRAWKGVTHFLMMERPREFNDEIKSFLKRRNIF